MVLALFALPLFLGGWKIIMNKGINPIYVDRIEDGKTKRSEILTLFGDPQETKRTGDGLSYVYKTYQPQGTTHEKKDNREFIGLSSVDSPSELEHRLQSTQKRKKMEGDKEVASTLTIYFKPDGETVMSHEFEQ